MYYLDLMVVLKDRELYYSKPKPMPPEPFVSYKLQCMLFVISLQCTGDIDERDLGGRVIYVREDKFE